MENRKVITALYQSILLIVVSSMTLLIEAVLDLANGQGSIVSYAVALVLFVVGIRQLRSTVNYIGTNLREKE